MLFLFFILSIAFAAKKEIDPIEILLNLGQRRFTSSSNLKKSGQEVLSYDIKFVKDYHSLDYNHLIDSVLCAEDKLVIVSTGALSDWKEGDVFTGNEEWGCEDGIMRRVNSITLLEEGEGRYKYELETTEVDVEDIFEYANIDLVNPEEPEDVEDVEENVLKALKAASTYSKTFTMSKTVTLVSKSGITSTITGTGTVPVTINGLSVTVNSKNTKKYTMKIGAKLTLNFQWKNVITKTISGSVTKQLYRHASEIVIPLQISAVTVNIKLRPVLRGKLSYSFTGTVTATMKYKKTYSASVTLNSAANPIIKATGSDTSTGARPTFSKSKSFTGEVSPELMIDLETKATIFGKSILTVTPTLRGRFQVKINNTKFTVTPSLHFDYSVNLLGLKKSGSAKIYSLASKTYSL